MSANTVDPDVFVIVDPSGNQLSSRRGARGGLYAANGTTFPVATFETVDAARTALYWALPRSASRKGWKIGRRPGAVTLSDENRQAVIDRRAARRAERGW